MQTISLNPPQRIAALIQREDTIYLGGCVLQAAGGWTRCGPTWLIPNVGWLVYGPGVGVWGTSRGLAQLATCDDASPQWHEVGWGLSPDPHLTFAMTDEAINASYMKAVKAVIEAAEAL